MTERHSLHELVRAFAAARLADADAVRLRHARHYAQVVFHAERELYLNGQALAGLALFDRERAHIDTGRAWALAGSGNADADALLFRYADATVYVGDLRYDMRRERIPQLEAQHAAAQRLERRDRESAALGNLGNAYYVLGDMRQAIAFHEQALIIDRELGDRRGESTALGSLGNAYADLGDAHQAITFYEQRLKIAHEIGDRRGESTALSNLGNAYVALGDARQAITFYEQALAIDRELGDRRGESIVSWNLGEALAKHGELARAAALMQVCVDYEWKIGHPDAEKDAVQLEHLRQRLGAEQTNDG